MNILKLTTICALATSALFLTQPAQAELVYDNSSDPFPTNFNTGTFEVGDEITLGGSGRTITNFTFQYFGSLFSGTEKAQFRIYANDGALVSSEASPGTLLYDSGIFGEFVAGATGKTFIFDDFGTGLVLPDTFTWSVQFSDLGPGAQAGLALFDPITVGSSFNDYWENDGTGWSLQEAAFPINFGARIEAVPEPSTVALGLIGAVAGVFAFRRQRR